MTSRGALTVCALIALATATPSFGQSALQVSVSSSGNFTSLAPGGSFALTASGIGQAVQATVIVQYSGSSTATISGVSVTGSSEITLQFAPTFPVTLNPGSSTSFVAQYLPSSGNFVTAETSIAFTVGGQTASSFLFSLTGTSPRATFTYSFSSGNLVNLNAGGAIAFPSTNTGASSAAVVNVSNSGSAVGSLAAVTLTGAAFQLGSNPAPAVLAPGQQVSFAVSFAPLTTGPAQGMLSLTFGGATVAFSLSGTATTPSLSASYALADGNVHALSAGTVITFPAIDIGATATAAVTISNQGTGSGSVTNIAVAGSTFRLTGLPLLPASVGPGQNLTFTIVFSPTQSGSYSGTFSLTMSGASISGQLSGSTAASNLTLGYIDPNTNNVGSLSNNSTLQFPATVVGSPTTITLVASNSGQGTGSINSLSISGDAASAFQLLSVPALPAAIPPAQQLRFAVRFSPPQQQTYGATLTVNINGQNLTIALSGQGTGPTYTYAVASPGASTPVASGSTITLANTAVGQTTTVTISVTNNGSASGQIAGVSVTGAAGLSLSNLPVFPVTLASGATQQFTLTFAPIQPGSVSGTLSIGSDSFTVVSSGLGPLLTYSYASSAGATSLAAGQVAIFSPIAVGSSESLSFTIQNTGTTAATVSSIGLAGPSAIFALQQLPSLPFNLNPNAGVTFAIAFLPNATGVLTATLAINTTTFTVSGTGTQPAPLPTYQFQGPSGNLQPASQPTVGLTLAAAYPLALQGTLTLAFTSAVFTDDPSIEFANGSRTISFTIPANSTQAMFSGSVTSVPIQTGTTAGTIVITPSFAISGGFDVTPPSPGVLSLTVPRAAPQLLSGSITSETLNGFTLVLSGYSTTRVLNNFAIQITTNQGVTLSTNHLSVDVSTSSAAWYQGAASQAFGGSFLVAIPFTLQNGSSTADLVHMLQSLSITAVNDVGTSSGTTVAIP